MTEQLTAHTYDVIDGARIIQRMMRGGDAPLVVSDYIAGTGGSSPLKKAVGDGAKKKSAVVGSYGAARGGQIAVESSCQGGSVSNVEVSMCQGTGDGSQPTV